MDQEGRPTTNLARRLLARVPPFKNAEKDQPVAAQELRIATSFID